MSTLGRYELALREIAEQTCDHGPGYCPREVAAIALRLSDSAIVDEQDGKMQLENGTLRTQLAEAVKLLRRIYQYSADLPFNTSKADNEEVAQYAIDECVAGDARDFLARIDGASDGKAGA